MKSKTDFLTDIQNMNPRLKLDLIERAYDLAATCHADQMRKSGDPYLLHLIEVAEILASLGMDSITVAAGLLHDSVEDTDITVAEVQETFGPEVALLVEGMSKIKEVKFKSHDEKQADYYRRLLLTMVEDARVIMIKLADRLHNVRTLEFHQSEEKRKRIAQETLDIYAPLAHRFGLAEIKWELEDISFKYLRPKDYTQIRSRLDEKRTERENFVNETVALLKEMMESGKVRARVLGRPKHIYSIYKKMVRQRKSMDKLDDLYAFRIIYGKPKSAVQRYLEEYNIKEEKGIPKDIFKRLSDMDERRQEKEITRLYYILGLIHQNYAPIPGTFDDYVASPKPNGYQSLHTTVMGPGGRKMEIQIRTYDMHRIAELGIAAHWLYKEGKNQDQYLSSLIPWVREMIVVGEETSDSSEFVDLLKRGLRTQRIICFTPEGDVVHLPKDSTPIDFAFAIHTEVGMHCRGAKINGKMVPLNQKLTKGDRVEIITSSQAKPARSWLQVVASSRAKSKIRRAIKEQEYEQNIMIGRDKFERELKINHVEIPTDKKIGEYLHHFDEKSVEDFFISIALKKNVIQQAIAPFLPETKKKTDDSVTIETIVEEFRQKSGVVIDGIDNVMMRIAACCQPVPGDDVVGFITRGRGMSIHLKTCKNIASYFDDDPARLVKLSWGLQDSQPFLTRIHVEGRYRRDLLAKIINAINSLNVSIRRNETDSNGKNFKGHFLLEVKDHDQLNKVVTRLKRVDGVNHVYRAKIFDTPSTSD